MESALAVKEYFRLLGGNEAKFPDETVERIDRFAIDLSKKRTYSKFSTFPSKSDSMVVLNKLRVFSFCEHHLLPFFGYASIAYIPDGKILGLSKFQRIVDQCASLPTVQEDLTNEIATKVINVLKPKGVGVSVTCIHTCIFGRGVQNTDVSVNTMVVTGAMKQNEITRNEFLQRITRHENILR